MRANIWVATVVAIFQLATTEVDATPQLEQSRFCVTNSGAMRLVTNKFPLAYWEVCKLSIAVKMEAVNTTHLTYNMSAAYDARLNAFTNGQAGGTTEFTQPGEHLLVLDYMEGKRNLIWSKTSNRPFFSNLKNIKQQLIPIDEIRVLMRQTEASQLYISIGAPTKLYMNKELSRHNIIGRGRFFAQLTNSFITRSGQYVEIVCLSASCDGRKGWTAVSDLAEIRLVETRDEPFPLVFEYPTRYLIKECAIKSKRTSSSEIKLGISQKLSAGSIGKVEFEVSLEAILKSTREQEYDKDVEIEWTIFTLLEFGKRGWLFQKYWHPRQPFIFIVEKFTRGCSQQIPLSRYTLIGADNRIAIGKFERALEIRNSQDHFRFVTDAKASLKGRFREWILRHMASAISAQRH